ncbi:unnamed protein product, partial [Amoebophrya sp. A120]
HTFLTLTFLVFLAQKSSSVVGAGVKVLGGGDEAAGGTTSGARPLVVEDHDVPSARTRTHSVEQVVTEPAGTSTTVVPTRATSCEPREGPRLEEDPGVDITGVVDACRSSSSSFPLATATPSELRPATPPAE